MPDITTGPPEPGTYSWVFVMPGMNPNYTFTEHMYGKVARSRTVELPEGVEAPHDRNRPHHASWGRRFPAMFGRDKTLRRRLATVGWVDITDEWFAALTGDVVEPDDGSGGEPPTDDDGGPTDPVEAVTEPARGGPPGVPVGGAP